MSFVAPFSGRRAVALALFGLAWLGGDAAVRPYALAQDGSEGSSQVRTIAGSGAAGIADGAAASASFLMPSGLALGRDGTLYVSDEAAQRIRAVGPGGNVVTLAGSGEIETPGLSVRGGFLDGAAHDARFNQPEGLALAPSGALYIADSANACVRKLLAGTVSTVVGRCGQPGRSGGSALQARLMSPRALAFDPRGNLYIADFGAGLRRLARDGSVTTIRLHSTTENRMMGVSVSPDGASVVATAPTLLIEYHPAAGSDSVASVDLAEGGRPFGNPFQVVGRDARQFFFSDLRSSTLRYLRLPAKPFVSTVFTRTIAGGTLERPIDNAGYRGGTRDAARFYSPSGLALSGNTLYVADAGNRRVRAVTLPVTRVSEAGLSGALRTDRNHHEIAYVGASWTFWDSLGDDSLCARLETDLNQTGKYPKPVRCHPVRIDAAGMPQMENYVKNVLAEENFN